METNNNDINNDYTNKEKRFEIPGGGWGRGLLVAMADREVWRRVVESAQTAKVAK